jgi:hypothetical protein
MEDIQGFPAPYPPVSDRTLLQYSTGRLFLRNYGLSVADLEVHFGLTHPLLVTSLLEQCTVSEDGKVPDTSFFWDLTVSERIECLLIIAGINDKSNFEIPLQCNSCGEMMEVEISLGPLLRNTLPYQFTVSIEGSSITLRRPRGRDQLEWLGMQFADEKTAVVAMARSLVVSLAENNNLPFLPETWITPMDTALRENDPLVYFTITACCPECGCEARYEIDLEEFSLKKLRGIQQRMLYDIHQIAKHYHWSESQILSIPQWRRAYYLELIDREEY